MSSFANQYALTASQFLEELDAFLLNNHKESLTLDLLGKFQQSLFLKSKVRIDPGLFQIIFDSVGFFTWETVECSYCNPTKQEI